jgi:hypothetical protein
VLVPTVQYSTVKYSTVTKCILEFNSLHERIIEAVVHVGGGMNLMDQCVISSLLTESTRLLMQRMIDSIRASHLDGKKVA